MTDRLTLAETPDGFEALVAGIRDARALRLGTLIVAVLVAGLIADAFLIYRALNSPLGAGTVIPFVLLFFVSLYWTPLVYTWLWNLNGRELVTAYDGRLRFERIVLRNMKFAFDFDMLDVSHVRVRTEPDDPGNLTLRHQQARYGLGGNVAFEVEGRPYRVGIALAEDDAERLAEAMRDALAKDSRLVLD